VIIAKAPDYIRDIQLVQCRYFIGNVTEYGSDAGILVKEIDAETPTFFGDIRKVEVDAFVKNFFLRVAQYLHDVAFQFGVTELAKLDGHQVAIHPQHWRDANGEVYIGAALCEAEFQE
jgi:hypothetical protein